MSVEGYQAFYDASGIHVSTLSMLFKSMTVTLVAIYLVAATVSNLQKIREQKDISAQVIAFDLLKPIFVFTIILTFVF